MGQQKDERQALQNELTERKGKFEKSKHKTNKNLSWVAKRRWQNDRTQT